jgi:hypothetical protein
MVKFIKAVGRTNPKISRTIFIEAVNTVAAERMRIIRFVLKKFEIITVVSIQAAAGTEPHESPAVPENSTHDDLGQSVFGSKVGKTNVLHPVLISSEKIRAYE